MASSLLISLFRHKAAIDKEFFAEVDKLDPLTQADDRRTAIRLLNHVFVVDQIFAGHLQGRDHGHAATNTPETPTLDSLLDAVADSDRWYVDHVETLTPAQLAEPVAFVFTDGQRGCMSREEMLAHVITHGSYHRGAVGRILSQASLTPPRDTLTTYLHRSEPQRRESAH